MSQIIKSSSGSGGSGIQTINGDSGSITGSTVTIYTRDVSVNGGATFEFIATSSNTALLQVTDPLLFNTLIGLHAGNLNLTGSYNTGLGISALNALTSGSQNTAVGGSALISLTSGQYNTAIGYAAGANLTTGNMNVFLGQSAGLNYTGAESYNTIVGRCQGTLSETHTIRIGPDGLTDGQAATSCYISGIYGVSPSTPQMVIIDSAGQLGSQAIPSSGGIVTLDGDTGSATGSTVTLSSDGVCGSTVKFVNTGATSYLNVTDASNNTIIGNIAGNSSISGSSNIGLGFAALHNLTSGSQNISVGQQSLGSIAGGNSNVAIGHSAMINCVSGSSNTAIGDDALAGCLGSYNTIVGNGSFFAITSANENVCLGALCGSNYTSTESNNILIGFQVVGVAAESNVTRIGSGGVQNACYIDGITGKTVTGTAVLCSSTGQLGTIVSSERYKENIVDMPAGVTVMNLRPVKFNYIEEKRLTSYPETHYGLIAEEVDRDFPYLCHYKDGQPESVKYHELCVFLLAELQRLEKRFVAHLDEQH